MSTSQEKNPGITFVLNFFIPGTGHLYASDGERWGLLAVNLVCAVTGAVIYLPWLGNIVVWVIAMVDSSNVTSTYNDRIREHLEQAEVRQAEEGRERKAEATRAAARVTGAAVAARLQQVASLETSGLLDADEARRERRKILTTDGQTWTDEDLATFLAPFAPLVETSTLRPEEFDAVKAFYAAAAQVGRRP